MKKTIAIIYIFLVIICNQSIDCEVFAVSQYARATESTNLYRLSENDALENVICIVEKSYFVEIISETESYYKVNYNNISGYVKKNEVKKVTSTPSTPFPYNIKIVIDSDCNLRSTPTIKSPTNNILTTLKSNESDITFIGRIFSDEAIDFGGTTWYYVNYQGYYGYVYNKYVKTITPIYENTEVIPYLNDDFNKIVNPITHTPSLVIIIILFIPCIFILLILYIPRKINNKIKSHKSPKIIDKY